MEVQVIVFLLVSAGIVTRQTQEVYQNQKPIRVEKEGKFVEFKPGPNLNLDFQWILINF